jgi:hypothetical protein
MGQPEPGPRTDRDRDGTRVRVEESMENDLSRPYLHVLSICVLVRFLYFLFITTKAAEGPISKAEGKDHKLKI